MDWDLLPSPRIVFQNGAFRRLAQLCPGERIVLVTTAGFTRRGVTDLIQKQFDNRIVHIIDRVEANPDMAFLDKEAATLKSQKPDLILGLGGGSAVDTAKVLGSIAKSPEDWSLEGHFYRSVPMGEWPAVPVVAIPTTSGTGAEVTPFATVWDKEQARKHSLVGPSLLPTMAILDPELTLGLPEDVTISTGLDAISQAMESLWNRKSNAVTEAWALQSLRHSLPAMGKLIHAPENLGYRSALMEGSLLAGLAISHTRTALAHSMSYPLTAHFDLSHGLACSFTLPAILAFNAEADPAKFEAISQALGFASTAEFGSQLLDLFRVLDVKKRVSHLVPDYEASVKYADEMFTPGRADNNLRAVTIEDIKSLLEQTWGII